MGKYTNLDYRTRYPMTVAGPRTDTKMQAFVAKVVVMPWPPRVFVAYRFGGLMTADVDTSWNVELAALSRDNTLDVGKDEAADRPEYYSGGEKNDHVVDDRDLVLDCNRKKMIDRQPEAVLLDSVPLLIYKNYSRLIR